MQQNQASIQNNEKISEAWHWSDSYEVLIVGGGSAGIAVAASLLKRRKNLRIAIVEPSETHYYQPAFTLVGGGVFNPAQTYKSTKSVLPKQAEWLKHKVVSFDPDHNQVKLDNGKIISYQQMVVCTGLVLAWDKIEGLTETLGKNGVTSNYRHDLASYTWQLVQSLKHGKALFTQPPMPIKCAGAPQKAMYLSCSHWLRNQVLPDIQVEFNTAGAVLFGVADFVPALMAYVKRYNANLVFNANLVKVDGNAKKAWFDIKQENGEILRVEKSFDMLHVVPPQIPPECVSNSPLADTAGWCDVDQTTLQHKRYANVFAVGDISNAPNAKTAAAARKHAVVVAENLLASKESRAFPVRYDGYGACPLTVEHGKVVLAEFGYGGKLLPTFPLVPTIPRRLSWWLKATAMPWVYWHLMLKGHEWLAKPSKSKD